MKYRIGQIITANQDIELEMALSGNKKIVPKGSKIIIGADKLGHHIGRGYIQPLQKDDEVKGYAARELAEYLYIHLRNHFEVDEMLEGYDMDKSNFIGEIEYALNEIGF